MKVIGKVEQKEVKGWKTIVVCKECDSKLEVCETDVYCDTINQPNMISDGIHPRGFYCTCVSCGSRVNLWPPFNVMKSAIYNRYTWKHVYNPSFKDVHKEFPDYTKEELLKSYKKYE